jgi:hypothetical protein
VQGVWRCYSKSLEREKPLGASGGLGSGFERPNGSQNGLLGGVGGNGVFVGVLVGVEIQLTPCHR